MSRALPQKYIARSKGHARVKARTEAVLSIRPELRNAINTGDFKMARKLVSDDDSLRIFEFSLLRRLIKLERLYQNNFAHPLSS